MAAVHVSGQVGSPTSDYGEAGTNVRLERPPGVLRCHLLKASKGAAALEGTVKLALTGDFVLINPSIEPKLPGHRCLRTGSHRRVHVSDLQCQLLAIRTI
jgi:hypothetical protein